MAGFALPLLPTATALGVGLLLGLGGVLLASLLIQALRGQWSIHEILITFFIFLTAPVSANLMAKAALHLRVESKAGHQPVDEADAATPRQG